MKNNFYPCTDLVIDVGKTNLKKSVYFKLLDDFFSNFGFYINIGGNVYSFPYIFEFIDYANVKGVKSIGIYLTRLTEEYARKFSIQGIRAVMFPFQNVDEAINDKILGGGSYKKTIDGLKIAKEYNLNTELITVINDKAFTEVPKILEFLIKNKIDLLIVARSIMARYYRLTLEQFRHSQYKKLLKYLIQENKKLKRGGLDKISLMSCPHKILIDDSLAEIDVMGGCSAGLISCYVSPKGTVHPCTALHNLVVGDIKKERFSNIWHNSTILADFRTRDKLKGKCKKCKYRLKCGGCRADAYYEYHDLWAEDPNCWI